MSANSESQKSKSAPEQDKAVLLDTKKLKDYFDVSHFNFDAIIRGAQLTLVGAHRALQNPSIFSNDHYRQAALAVAIGIGIRVILYVPIFGLRVFIWLFSLLVNLESTTWDESVLEKANFIGESVLQVPFFLMTLMRYLVPTLDNLFMQSLQWVDQTYTQKHKQEDPSQLRRMYYQNLKLYHVTDGTTHSSGTAQSMTLFMWKFTRKGLISLAIFLASYLPYVGRFVLPAASFYTFNNAVGLGPASVIFGTGILLPRRYLVVFLQSYFSSRSLMRELLEPYFARVKFTQAQKRNWFRNREGVLFGFGLGIFFLVKIPLVGVLIYGIAEASTAYLITKITDPPPPPRDSKGFAATQQSWANKHEFLKLPLADLDEVKR